ncbi:undecaprenyl diphosphate synthase family protein, partial [Salmonella enterica]|uniref:undecaprenyl diphosphate synthase family protein n=1 Tax=Salmonella enterica TaxID=28901 RepID=UPI003296C936
AVRRTVRAAAARGIRYLTIYSFSSENWRRPASEIADLMNLLKLFVRRVLAELLVVNVGVRIIGEVELIHPYFS